MGKKSLHLLALFCLLICYCIPQQISSGTSSHKPYLVFIRYDIIKIRWYGVCADQLFPVIIHLWQMVTSYFSVPCKPFCSCVYLLFCESFYYSRVVQHTVPGFFVCRINTSVISTQYLSSILYSSNADHLE